MDKKPRRSGLLEKTAEALDLPADALAGLPRLELVGDKELRMENHEGILAYGSEEIHISGGVFVVKVVGCPPARSTGWTGPAGPFPGS